MRNDICDRRDASLFLDSTERQRWDDFLTRELAAAQERVVAGSVVPTIDQGAFGAALADFDFKAPRAPEQLLCWTIAQLEHGLVHITHPRYFGLFNPGPTTPSQWADRIAATFNPQLATWTTSPAAVAIESHVIRAVAGRAGLAGNPSGHFTTGGAEANQTALVCALTRSNPGFAAEGARAFGGPAVLYASKDCHLAWIKIAHQSGIGRSAVRLIRTDESGRMDLRSLADTIAADRREGCVPVMVVATAGTTNAGMIDPLPACAALARSVGAWFHVDAAWGGGLIASERLRHSLAGIEEADSITIDAHKWFATTMGCGMFLTRHREVLSVAFDVSTGYMPSHTRDLDPYVTTMQWSRRFLGLRLFLSLGAAGWDGYAGHVEHAVELAAMLGAELVARNWRILNQSPLAVLCLEPPPGSPDVRSIVGRVLASGRAWVSVATFQGRDVLRACVTHGETTADDIGILVETLTEAL
jgi:glutamate/tyrosine decarboxylase-like PLP-dependent enzyme